MSDIIRDTAHFLCDKRMPSAASSLAGRGLSERSLSGLRTRDDPSNRVGVSLLDCYKRIPADVNLLTGRGANERTLSGSQTAR